MNVSPVASSTKVQSALSNLGIPEGFIANDVVPLLQQLVVALGNVTSGGGGSTSLDVGSTVVDGGTTGYVLYDNSGVLGELGTSIGGNESSDAGKLVKFGPTGNLVGSLVQALNPASSPVVTTKLNYNEVLFTTGVSASASLRSAGGSSVYNLPNIASGTYNVITSGDTGSVTDTMLAGSISNSKLSNSAITIAGTSTSLGGSISQDTITGLSSTGLVKRTAANTLSIASAGTDYVSPSGTLALGGFGSITGTLGASNGGTGISSLGTGVATALGNAVNASSGLLTYSIIGTSGATLGLLNTANTFSAAQTIALGSGTTAFALTPFTNGTNTLRVNLAAGTPIMQAGNLSGNTTYGAVYLGNVTPGSTNYALAANTVNTYLNGQTGGSAVLAVNDSARISANATTSTIKGDVVLDKTVTAGGTTGAQTINKTSGSVNFAAAATSLVVTNSLCATSSIIQCTIATNDATAAAVKAVAGSGSFTIYLGTAPTAETRINFTLTN